MSTAELKEMVRSAMRMLRAAERADTFEDAVSFILAAVGTFDSKELASRPVSCHEERVMYEALRAAAVCAIYGAAADDTVLPEELKRTIKRYIREVRHDGKPPKPGPRPKNTTDGARRN